MGKLTREERDYLRMGATRPGGKLPLFDEDGQVIRRSVIKGCVEKGLAERWFGNPLKPDWMVCRLTEQGRNLLG